MKMPSLAGRLGAVLAAMLLVAPGARAVIVCNASATSISVAYNPVGATVVTSGAYTVSCTRAGGDPSTVAWALQADNGLQQQGQNSRVQLAGSYYKYELFTNAGLSANAEWSSAPPASKEFSGTLNFGAGTTATTSGPFYVQILAPQTAGPAGVYTDLVTTTLIYDATNTTSLGAFNISVNSITNCTLGLPASLVFNYASFQGAAATPSANFSVNCTTGLPYTMALDSTGPITDDAVFLTYTLGLSAAGGTGAGIDQFYQITGNMAGGQSGSCATALCTNAAATNRTRTLTVTW